MANKVFVNPETKIVWAVGGTPDLDLGALAADGVRVGQQTDRGASARSAWFYWEMFIDGFDTAPVVGERVEIYLAMAHESASVVTGTVGVADAAGVTVALPNLLHLGGAAVQTTTAGDNLVVSGEIYVTARYLSVVVHNNTADALLGTADAHLFTLTPMPPELQ